MPVSSLRAAATSPPLACCCRRRVFVGAAIVRCARLRRQPLRRAAAQHPVAQPRQSPARLRHRRWCSARRRAPPVIVAGADRRRSRRATQRHDRADSAARVADLRPRRRRREGRVSSPQRRAPEAARACASSATATTACCLLSPRPRRQRRRARRRAIDARRPEDRACDVAGAPAHARAEPVRRRGAAARRRVCAGAGRRQDATLLARVARADGARSIAVVAADAPFQRRFVQRSTPSGGATAAPRRANTGSTRTRTQLGALRRELAARPTDAIVLAVDGEHAALAKSFLPPARYTRSARSPTACRRRSRTTSKASATSRCRGWPIPTIRRLPACRAPTSATRSLERLYALGLDAFALAQMLAAPVPPERSSSTARPAICR